MAVRFWPRRQSTNGSTASQARISQPRRRRPRLEELDRRCLPATFLVNNLTDAPIVGQTNLRQAIALANADPGSTIAFDPAALGGSPRTIALAQGELEITAAVAIAGPGAGALAISGGNASRIFDIDDGTAATIAVSISGLTLADGNAAGDVGGAIRSVESLALADSTVSNSLALDGGGIANIGGNLRLDRVTLAGNAAKGSDGTDSPFPSNVPYTYTWLAGSYTDNGGAAGGARGGGIYSSGGAVTIADSTLTNNQAQGGEGGRGGWTLNGIRSGDGGNGGAGEGGGIYSGGGSLELIGSTLSGNSALGGAGGYGGQAGYPLNGGGGPINTAGNAGAGGAGRGGGLFADGGSSVTLTNSTLSDNAARGGIGGDGLWGWNGHGGEASNGDPDYGGGGSGEGGGLFATRTGAVLISDSGVVRNLAIGGDSGDGGIGSDVGGSGAVGGEARGGGLFLSANGAVAVVRTTIAFGAATGGIGGDGGSGVDYGGIGIIGGDARGGGIYLALDGPAEIADSAIFGNTASGGAGGNGGNSNGWAGPGGSGGTAAGGGAFVEGGAARFTQATFSGNSVRGGNGGAGASSSFMFPWSANGESGVGGSGLGGGLYTRSAVSLNNTTLAFGAATPGGGSTSLPQYAGVGRGGNFYNEWSATLNNTLIAGSLAGGDVYTPGSFAGRSSLIQDPANQPLIDGADGNIIGRDPRLGVLSYYGGPTATVPLLGDSPAIDAGDPGLAVDAQGNPMPNDQRGVPFARRSGASVDIGAFEHQEIAARTFVVNTAADDGGGPGLLTLREALGLANVAPGSTIAFDPAVFSTPRTIALALGELPTITADVTINGPGARLLTISGGDRSRILTINDRSPEVIDVTISGLTLDRGNPNGGAGGAIFNTENLALIDSTVSGNTARVGGGIYNSGVLNLSGCTIVGNATVYQGVENLPPGGYAYASQFGFGAGLYSIGAATLINSTITGNKAIQFGVAAGIFNYYGPLTLTNCTVAGNEAASNVDEIGSTVPITMNNTLVVGELGTDILVGGISGANNWIGGDPGLDPAGLKDNGGPTDTIALLPGSPAIDAGSNALLPAGLGHDQRGLGFARAFNGTVDIGAFEYSTTPSVIAVTSTTPDGTYGVGSAIVIEVAFGGPVTVGGTPSLLLNSGGTAVYASGSGTDRLVFIYNVAAGQGTADLDYASIAALQLDGGTIRDAAGQDADLALPAPGGAGSLGANKDIAIDTVAPTVLAFRLLFGGTSYDLIGSPSRILPWRITGIQVVFSKPIAAGSAAGLAGLTTTGLIGLGTTTLTWSIDPLTGGAFLPSLLATGADALRDAAGNAVGGGAGFSAPFRILYGDYNGDGAVSSADVTGILLAASQSYNMLADLDLNGVVDANDARIARSRIGSKL